MLHVVTGGHEVKGVRIKLRIPVHEGKFLIHLSSEDYVRATSQPANEIRHDVCVAAQAVLEIAPDFRLGHLLHQNVHTPIDEVTRYVGIVRANVVALRLFVSDELACREIELANADVWRERTLGSSLLVAEVRVVAEDALHEWPQKPPLEVALAFGPCECERGVDGEIHLGVGDGATVEGVEKVVWLTGGKRSADAQRFAYPLEYSVDADIWGRDLFHTSLILVAGRHVSQRSNASVSSEESAPTDRPRLRFSEILSAALSL